MDITIYLPDDIGERAKREPGINLSRLLRDALTDEFARRDAVSDTLSETQNTYEVDVEDENGRAYTGRITGHQVAQDDRNNLLVFLTQDEHVILYDTNRLQYWVLEDRETEFRDALYADAYADACDSLGITPVIDL